MLWLGWAFLVQFATSLTAGVLAGEGPLATPRTIGETMRRTAERAATHQWSVLLDVATGVGVIWLGVMLYHLLKAVNRAAALTGMVLYVAEATTFAASRCAGLAVLHLSTDYAASGDPGLEPAASALLWLKDGAFDVSMIFFGAGAVVLYTLLILSKSLPTWLPMWGLVAVIPILAGAVLAIFDRGIPFALQALYVPFELVLAVYILIRERRRGGTPVR
jgi:hypothetical protein